MIQWVECKPCINLKKIKKKKTTKSKPQQSVEFGPMFLVGNMQNANYIEKG